MFYLKLLTVLLISAPQCVAAELPWVRVAEDQRSFRVGAFGPQVHPLGIEL